jgi:hypothetical protein
MSRAKPYHMRSDAPESATELSSFEKNDVALARRAAQHQALTRVSHCDIPGAQCLPILDKNLPSTEEGQAKRGKLRGKSSRCEHFDRLELFSRV